MLHPLEVPRTLRAAGIPDSPFARAKLATAARYVTTRHGDVAWLYAEVARQLPLVIGWESALEGALREFALLPMQRARRARQTTAPAARWRLACDDARLSQQVSTWRSTSYPKPRARTARTRRRATRISRTEQAPPGEPEPAPAPASHPDQTSWVGRFTFAAFDRLIDVTLPGPIRQNLFHALPATWQAEAWADLALRCNRAHLENLR